METQGTFEDVSPEYAAFVEKFKPRKTTDDCYTPANVYGVVADWAARRYGFDKARIVRPFWPGGDFERLAYPEGCVVVDNPPFSIMKRITDFYNRHGVRFFLFGPALTILSGAQGGKNNYVCVGITLTYANGAGVATSFITNMGEYLIETAPDLYDALEAANEENERKLRKHLPRYTYPPDVITAASTNYLCVHHTPWRLKREDAVFIRCMDAQVGTGKTLFGGGFLLSERAAAERAAAERAAAERAAAERAAAERAADHRWELSDREREIQKLMTAEQPEAADANAARRVAEGDAP